MRLVWHIAKKDLRRMAPAIGLWLVFIAATTIWFRVAQPWGGGEILSSLGMWLAVMRIWVQLLLIAQLLFAFLLAGALILEDPLVGATNWWTTRPIANPRLFVAKLLAAAILFVGAPSVILTIVWMATGFTRGDALVGIGRVGIAYGSVVLVALMVASLTRRLVGFLLATVVIGATYFAVNLGGHSLPFFSAPSVMDPQVPGLLLIAALAPIAAIVLSFQFLTRRTTHAWVVLGATVLVAAAIIREPAMWRATQAAMHPRWPAPTAIDRTADIRVTPSFDGSRGLSVTAPWTKDGFYVAEDVALAPGLPGAIKLIPTQASTAALRAIGFDNSNGPLTWKLWNRDGWKLIPRAGAHVTGELEVSFMRPRILGELPLREGAMLASGADRIRILGFQRTGERLDGILLQESDAVAGAFARLASGVGSGIDYVDTYVLVDRAAHRAHSLPMGAWIGAVAFNGFASSCHRFGVSGNSDWKDGVLVKVRFERVRSFAFPFTIPNAALDLNAP